MRVFVSGYGRSGRVALLFAVTGAFGGETVTFSLGKPVEVGVPAHVAESGVGCQGRGG